MRAQAHLIASRLWWHLVVLIVIATRGYLRVRPDMWTKFLIPPYVLTPLAVIALMVAMGIYLGRGRDLAAFLSSAGLVLSLEVATGTGLYPYLLPARPHPAQVHLWKRGGIVRFTLPRMRMDKRRYRAGHGLHPGCLSHRRGKGCLR